MNHHKQIWIQKISRKLTNQGWTLAEVRGALDSEQQESRKGHAPETIWFAYHPGGCWESDQAFLLPLAQDRTLKGFWLTEIKSHVQFLAISEWKREVGGKGKESEWEREDSALLAPTKLTAYGSSLWKGKPQQFPFK